MIDPELFAEVLVQNMELRRLLEQARSIAASLEAEAAEHGTR